MAYLEEMEEMEEKIEEMPEEGGSEEMEVEETEEEVSASPSLEEGVARLIENWNPETPEGERYLEELKEVMAGGGEEMAAMGETEESEETEDDEAPGPSMGFDIVAMRKRAAKNAFPEM
mgnify:CR=1 FL=1|tara:strand:- start:2751 stop:3107 length:357 start_codon:yes stop_codon:yes gene_type:complete